MKRNYFKFIFVFLIYLLIESCNFKKSPKENLINSNKFLHTLQLSQGKPIESNMITKMAFFLPFQDYLILQDIYSSTEGIYILNKKTLKQERSFGKIGKGPKEIGRYGTIFTDEKNGCFYLADFGKSKIWYYDFDSLLTNKDYFPKGKFTFNIFPGIYPLDFIIKKDTLYFLSDIEYFTVKVINADSIEYIGKYKNNVIKYKKDNKEDKTFITRVTANFNKTRFAFAYNYADLITITDENYNPIVSVLGNKKMYNGKKVFDDIFYYVNVKSDEEFIYGGYLNKPMLQYDDKYGNNKLNYPQMIKIFTWSGEPVLEIISENPFSDYYVDRENNRVILYLVNKEKPIFVYDVDFKGLLN